MQVELLHNTPLHIADLAISKCWDTNPKEGDSMKERIHRVGNKNKHSSTLEHLNYTFDIDGISRACLQELARHRHTSLSVKSTRYTLKELKGEVDFLISTGGMYSQPDVQRASKYLVFTDERYVDDAAIWSLENLRRLLNSGYSNDITKYALPEAYKTSLVWTINARSLQNFLNLRTDKAALWEIRQLAWEIYMKLPNEHIYLFEEFMKGEKV